MTDAGRTVPGNRWDLLDGLCADPPPLVSVIVVHYRQQSELDRTLASLARQTYPAHLIEVIVVDDGSPEPPTVPPGVRLLRQRDDGFRAAAARNAGAAVARGTVLCFLDADTSPEPGYIAALSRLPALAPDVVTIGRRLHADLDRADHTLPGVPVEIAGPQHPLPDPAWLREHYVATNNLLQADDRSYRYVIGAVLACSRALFAEVGGFDETFTTYGGEDWEWAYRAWLAGALLAHEPRAVGWHNGPDWSGRSAAGADRQRAKNLETARLAHLIPAPASRGRGLHFAHADVQVVLAAADSPVGGAAPCGRELDAAAVLVCVDSVLEALPAAVVEVPDESFELLPRDRRVIPRSVGATSPPVLDRVRIRVLLHGPVTVTAAGLGAAIERVTREELASLTLTDADGIALVTVVSARAAARIARWGDPSLFEARAEAAHWVEPVDGQPDLEAWFGGWGR
ncbi:MAG: glycosyltransferase family 2 protein [Burkholderiaceae bacterium]|nr:glycosyltransferase family 2 protein [Microbacteriaceae bacterium]